MRNNPRPFLISPARSALLLGFCTALASCGGGGAGAVAQDGPATASGDPTVAPSPSPAAGPPVATTAVNAALVPSAKPGAPNRRINNTGDMPYRDPDGMGAFRTVCNYSHMNFDDPLVYPGQVGKSHLHVFFGNSGTTANSTPDSIATTGDGSCRGGIVNRSAYWVPALITSSGQPLTPLYADMYYKTGYDLFGQNDQVVPIPPRFRMIAGNSKSTTSQSRAYTMCDGQRQSALSQCGGDLTQVVEFPQCWDGVNLDSPDHRSHVLYAENGRCASTHPVHLPMVSYHIHYGAIPGGVRLSSDITGSPAGASGHGDWMNGWEQDVLNSGINNIVKRGLSGGSHIVGDGRTIYY